MKITLLTYGTRGDVQPFVALALGLQRAGHAVRLAAPQRFAALASMHHVPFAPLPGDPEELSRRINDAREPFTAIRSVANYIFSIAGEVARAAFAACEDADLIVHSYLFTTGGHSLARRKGIPDVSVQLMPMFAPTHAFPCPAMPELPAGPLSYFSHQLMTWVFWHGGNFGYSQLRRRYADVAGLQLHWPFDAREPNPTPLIFAYSPTVLPCPADWSASHIHVAGYLFLEAPADYEPPVDLAEFLRGGDAPVCVTFGSMVNRDARRVHEAVRAALRQTGQRAVIVRGWRGTGLEQPADDVLYVDAMPYDWLFPRCKTIIHHGGAGTTAAALRAGVPSVVMPHGADQAFWGHRMASLGASADPIPVRKQSVERLVRALIEAEQPRLRQGTLAASQRICAEDGVSECVRVIERTAR